MSSAAEVNDRACRLMDAGQLEAALAEYERATALEPGFGAAHYNLGNCFQALGRMEEAVQSYARARELCPGYAPIHNNLGTALHRLGRTEQAQGSYLKAIELSPSFTEAEYGLGNLALECGKVEEAAYRFRTALRLRPDFAQAHFNLGLTLLLAGDYDVGWAEYEWRWRCAAEVGLRQRVFAEPCWRGEDARKKTVLVHAEQGFGDTIQFVRYLAALRPHVGALILESQPELARLLRSLPWADQVVSAGDVLPRFDAHVPLLSLPHVLKQHVCSPPAWPYLAADPALAETWAGRLPAGGLKVGLVWSGRPQQAKDAARSLSLPTLAPLMEIPGIRLYALQKGDAEQQLRDSVMQSRVVGNLAPLLVDFADTAAALAQLDLLISVDTAVAHLAAALGRPVWLLLAQVPNWRWGLVGETTTWYPTMRLFRQVRKGDWTGVVQHVTRELWRRTNMQAVTGRNDITRSGAG